MSIQDVFSEPKFVTGAHLRVASKGSNIVMLEYQKYGEHYLSPDTNEKVENLIMRYKQGEITVMHH